MFVDVPTSVSVPPSMPKKLTGISRRAAGTPVRRGDVEHERDRDCNRGRVVDEARHRTDEQGDHEDLAGLGGLHQREQALADHVDRTRALHTRREDEHAQHGDGGRTREPGEAFGHRGKRGFEVDATLDEPLRVEHDRDGHHDEEDQHRRDVERQLLGGKQKERARYDYEDDRNLDCHDARRVFAITQRSRNDATSGAPTPTTVTAAGAPERCRRG